MANSKVNKIATGLCGYNDDGKIFIRVVDEDERVVEVVEGDEGFDVIAARVMPYCAALAAMLARRSKEGDAR